MALLMMVAPLKPRLLLAVKVSPGLLMSLVAGWKRMFLLGFLLLAALNWLVQAPLIAQRRQQRAPPPCRLKAPQVEKGSPQRLLLNLPLASVAFLALVVALAVALVGLVALALGKALAEVSRRLLRSIIATQPCSQTT